VTAEVGWPAATKRTGCVHSNLFIYSVRQQQTTSIRAMKRYIKQAYSQQYVNLLLNMKKCSLRAQARLLASTEFFIFA
jgi:hypothetical protein